MALTAKGKNRNMFAKKNTQPEEQVLQDIMDEQLSQVTSGSLAGDGVSAFSTATDLAHAV